MKICSKCKKEYPATAECFYRNSKRKDGLAIWCKSCTREYYRTYRAKQGATVYKRWTKENAEYLKERTKGSRRTNWEECLKLSEELGTSPHTIKHQWLSRLNAEKAKKKEQGQIKAEKEQKYIKKDYIHEFKKGQQVSIERKIGGRFPKAIILNCVVTGVFKHFILVKLKLYNECFAYRDMVTGRIKITRS